MDWIDLARDGAGWRGALANTVLKPSVPENARNFRLKDY
jgi:hypothetical protein